MFPLFQNRNITSFEWLSNKFSCVVVTVSGDHINYSCPCDPGVSASHYIKAELKIYVTTLLDSRTSEPTETPAWNHEMLYFILSIIGFGVSVIAVSIILKCIKECCHQRTDYQSI